MNFTFTHTQAQRTHTHTRARTRWWWEVYVSVCARLFIREASAKHFSNSLVAYMAVAMLWFTWNMAKPNERTQSEKPYRSHFNQHKFAPFAAPARSFILFYLGVSHVMDSHPLHRMPTAALTADKMICWWRRRMRCDSAAFLSTPTGHTLLATSISLIYLLIKYPLHRFPTKINYSFFFLVSQVSCRWMTLFYSE